MKTIRQIELDQQFYESLLCHFEERKFLVDQEIIYRGHIPFAGLLLLDGQIVAKNTRSIQKLKKGTLIGVRELIEKSPLKYSVEVIAGSSVFIFDRTTILSFKRSKEKVLENIFKKIVE